MSTSLDFASRPAAGPRAASAAEEAARLAEALVLELGGEKIDLPSFPEVAARVRQALTSDSVDVSQIVRIVSAEPALATRLLQLANSAAICVSGNRTTDLKLAVSRIGFNMTRSAAIAFAMSQLRRAEAYRNVAGELDVLWKHSVHVAALCRVVAQRFTQVNPDQALLAGLLQGVGRLYLLTRAARYPALLADAGEFNRLVSRWDERVTGCILRHWEVAEPIIDALAAVERHDAVRDGAIDLVDVLAVARALASLTPAPAAEEMLFLGMTAARRLKLDAESCLAVLTESNDSIQSLRQALGS